MTTQLKIILLAATLAGTVFTSTARTRQVPRIYMFGMAASFTDSLVYFTGVQQVDSAWVDQKSHFLKGRDNYSYQLRNFLSNQYGLHHRTCIVMYNEDRRKLEKEYLKMRELYTTKARQPFEIHDLTEQDFRFTCIDVIENAE